MLSWDLDWIILLRPCYSAFCYKYRGYHVEPSCAELWTIFFYFSIDLGTCPVRFHFSIAKLKKSQACRVVFFSFPLVKLGDPTMTKQIGISSLTTWFPVLSLSQWNNEMHILIHGFVFCVILLIVYCGPQTIHSPPGFVNKVLLQHSPTCSVTHCLWFHCSVRSWVLIAETIRPTFWKKFTNSWHEKRRALS